MRIPEAVRMPDDGGHAPVWARTSRSGGGGGAFFGVIGFLLAAFAVLVIVLAGLNGWKFEKAGGKIDGWVCAVIAKVHPTKDKPAAAVAAPKTEAAPAAAPAAAAAPAKK